MAAWDQSSARHAAAEGRLQEWILAYLEVPEWANPGLARRVRAYATVWEGPILVSLSDRVRIAGPGAGYRFPQDPEAWEAGVSRIVADGLNAERLPPLILWRNEDGGLNVADGNHRMDALARVGITEAWALVSPHPLRASD